MKIIPLIDTHGGELRIDPDRDPAKPPRWDLYRNGFQTRSLSVFENMFVNSAIKATIEEQQSLAPRKLRIGKFNNSVYATNVHGGSYYEHNDILSAGYAHAMIEPLGLRNEVCLRTLNLCVTASAANAYRQAAAKGGYIINDTTKRLITCAITEELNTYHPISIKDFQVMCDATNNPACIIQNEDIRADVHYTVNDLLSGNTVNIIRLCMDPSTLDLL